jgi:hypothetical protein
VWVDIVRLGKVFQEGQEFDITADVVASFQKNFARLQSEGYRLGISRQHEDDGYVYGEVHELRTDGEYLQGLVSFADVQDRDAYNQGKIRHFSPGIDWEMEHPHTGENLGPALFHLAFVSEPQQKNLRYPQELNAGVVLSARHTNEDQMSEKKRTELATAASMLNKFEQFEAMLGEWAEVAAKVQSMKAALAQMEGAPVEMAEEEPEVEAIEEPSEEEEPPVIEAADDESEEEEEMQATPADPLAAELAAARAEIEALKRAAVESELAAYVLDDAQRAALSAVGLRDGVDSLRVILSATQKPVERTQTVLGTNAAPAQSAGTGKALAMINEAWASLDPESADRGAKTVALFKRWGNKGEILHAWDRERIELSRAHNKNNHKAIIERMAALEKEL